MPARAAPRTRMPITARLRRAPARWANDTHYGLAAFVFSKDLDAALRAAHRIEAGWVQVNRSGGQLPGMSYGGKKLSGLGSEYSIEGALESFTQRKGITIGIG